VDYVPKGQSEIEKKTFRLDAGVVNPDSLLHSVLDTNDEILLVRRDHTIAIKKERHRVRFDEKETRRNDD
jgi:chromatin remodeling complex protein RSC6